MRISFRFVIGVCVLFVCSLHGCDDPGGGGASGGPTLGSDGRPAVDLDDVFRGSGAGIATTMPSGTGSMGGPGFGGMGGQPPEGVVTETQVMDMLASDDRNMVRGALLQVVARRDVRFVPVIIELMRLEPMRQQRGAGMAAWTFALEALTDQPFGASWPAWASWYGSTEIAPPAGFTAFKGKLFSRIDKNFEQFFVEGAPSDLRVELVTWGGVKLDGIPSLDNPKMIAASEATYLSPEEPVFGIVLGDDARAYPLRIMDWHEMSNDVIGGVPVAIAYCTLCNAAIAYDTRVEGMDEPLIFGSSGLLYESNKLMYDRKTMSLWNQITGKPAAGNLMGKGIALKRLPIVTAKWKDWVKQHPETQVLSLETGVDRPYEPGAPYGGYFSSPGLMFPISTVDKEAKPKTIAFVVEQGAMSKGYPIEVLASKGVLNDQVGDVSVALVSSGGAIEVTGQDSRSKSEVTYTIGAEVRAYDRGSRTFKAGAAAGEVVDGDGATWRVTEAALVGPGGEKAARLAGHLAYWFGWYAGHPEAVLYREAGEGEEG